jgi:tetratricopeptide (TPR) repeat protein
LNNRPKRPPAKVAAPAAQAKSNQPAQKRMMKLDDAVTRASQLYTAGRLDAAEDLCRQIIAARPNRADVHNILGVILHRKGQAEAGIKSVREATRLNSSNPNFYSNLGEMERKAGHLDAAATALRRAVSLDDKAAQAHNNLGIVYYDQHDYQKAAEHYGKALAIDDKYAEAHNNMGNAQRALGDTEAALAEYERAIEMRENYAEAYNNMGTALRDQQKFEEAEYSYQRALQIRPNYIEAANNLATLLIQQKRYDEALRSLGDILKVQPKHVPTLVCVARAQLMRGAYGTAERATKLALVEDPENVEALTLLGQICHELDRFEDSVAKFEQVLKIKPNNVDALNFYGITLKSLGRMDEARKMFAKALELQPRAIGAYSNMVDLENFSKDDALFKAMLGILEKAKNPNEERYMALHFALGKAYEDMKEHPKALEHYSTGAKLKRATLKYDEAEVFGFFDSIRETFNEAYFAKPPYEGLPTSLPLFIIGMPRSGSTLTEQIISAHPDVYGAGEIKLLSVCLTNLRQKFPNLPRFPKMVTGMKPQHFASVANGYLKEITAMSPSAVRVTDKLLTNYFFAGLIHTLFPNAKIIHTMRDPIDTCLSAYSKLFKDDMPHSYDLRELGRYYKKYEQLMEHWRRVLPAGVMLDVQYEDVIADPEKSARRVIEFIGLPWNDACLEFHRSDRPVKTASVSQVRKPIYATSVKRWERYGEGLQPLVDALNAGIPAANA